MTIKKMNELMENIKSQVMNNKDRELYLDYIQLKKDILKEIGYTSKYNNRIYLPKRANKEQVEMFLNATMIAYDMIYNQ